MIYFQVIGMKIEALLSPAEYQSRRKRGFAGATCVVFDVLRATSVMVTGLANGARSFIPVEEISEALAWRNQQPDILLAGERNGLRIKNADGQGTDFGLGNSPREYVRSQVAGRDIVTTTTNGTRALRACGSADVVLVGSFLNLTATARWLVGRKLTNLMLICAGTEEFLALEDVLCAGALTESLRQLDGRIELSDATRVALATYQEAAGDLINAVSQSRNGARLLANPDLRDDVGFCLQRDVFNLVAVQKTDGEITAVP